MADSRRIKYYRVLRRVRKKVWLWGKHGGTLLFQKSMPFLFLATISSLLYLFCFKLGSMDFFQSLLLKMGCSLGSRVLLNRGLGWLLLVFFLSAFGIFDGTIMNMTGGNETINQGPHRGDAGPSSIQSDSLIAHASSEEDSDKELFFTPRQSVSSASSSSTSTPGIDSSPNNGQNAERDSLTYIKPGCEEHEAMKESLIRIARGKLEEWEASGWISGSISKKTNEELSQVLNTELIQTKEKMEIIMKELLSLECENLENVPAGKSYASFVRCSLSFLREWES